MDNSTMQCLSAHKLTYLGKRTKDKRQRRVYRCSRENILQMNNFSSKLLFICQKILKLRVFLVLFRKLFYEFFPGRNHMT